MRFSTRPRLKLALLLVAVFLAAPADAGSDAAAAGGLAAAPAAKTRTRSVSFEGIRVVYDDAGRGDEALVLVHGWACDRTFWRFQVPALAAKSRVIAIDLPGHGESGKPDVDYTEDLFARAVHAVLVDARVRRAVIVGHSMGTPVARQFYRLYPQQTRGLVFVDGALRMLAPKSVSDARFAALEGPAYEQIIGQIFGGLLGKNIADPLRAQLLAAMLRTPKNVVISAGKGLDDEALYATDPVGVPVLALVSSASGWPPDNEQFLRSIAPDLDYRVWDGVGHFLMIERPGPFNDAVLGFLRRVNSAKLRKAA